MADDNGKAARDRRAGILLHPTSLPGRGEVGDIGPAAHRWLDWLAEARCGLWQFLPLGPTGYADSPYQSFSAFASNPLLISLEGLLEAGYLSQASLPEPAPPSERVNFGRVYTRKRPLLAEAARNLLSDPPDDYEEYCRSSSAWLDEFALFMALKDSHQGAPWWEWESGLSLRSHDELQRARARLTAEMDNVRAQQYLFERQWAGVRQAAAERDILLVGDMPIFVALDSVDVWANPELFLLDQDRVPLAVAGVPPDYFSSTGQLWGNPIYDWERMKANGYRWWKARLERLLTMVDTIRLDHFRGFEAYWKIPAGAQTAVSGRWEPGPAEDLFQTLRDDLGELPIIAEDLGVITPAVTRLRERFGLPGMKVLQFAFDGGSDNVYLPHNYTSDMVAYTGTHDNDTVRGWFEAASPTERNYARRYSLAYDRGVPWAMIRLVWSSVADWSVAPLQDLLELGSQARMNEPGTERGNWVWRAMEGQYGQGLAARIRELNLIYGRASSPQAQAVADRESGEVSIDDSAGPEDAGGTA